MNKNIFLFDTDTETYCKTVSHISNKTMFNIVFDGTNYCIFGKKLSLNKLKDFLQTKSFVPYTNIKNKYTCCGKNHNFENYMKHFKIEHDAFLYPRDNKYYCYVCEIEVEDGFQSHLEIHKDFLHSENEFKVCHICYEFEIVAFDPTMVHSYTELHRHLRTRHPDEIKNNHNVRFYKEENVIKGECECGLNDEATLIILHLCGSRPEKKITCFASSITTNKNVDLRNTDCCVCLEPLKELVYKCNSCNSAICLVSCTSGSLENESGCPYCRNLDY